MIDDQVCIEKPALSQAKNVLQTAGLPTPNHTAASEHGWCICLCMMYMYFIKLWPCTNTFLQIYFQPDDKCNLQPRHFHSEVTTSFLLLGFIYLQCINRRNRSAHSTTIVSLSLLRHSRLLAGTESSIV